MEEDSGFDSVCLDTQGDRLGKIYVVNFVDDVVFLPSCLI